ncbi:hypothetical protein HHK36_016223 [Tetracentron sinense]|uniref:CBM20 domain-containing protein n=1 Tax=Tetracentron sinense TaxID=13715 RepID=A0A834YZA9_TETSI|nr:hypothetical protein HHK36_016223 [Tetracentron sinense]
MEALASSSSKISVENYRNKVFSHSRALLIKPELSFLQFQKLNVDFSSSFSLKHKAIQSIASSSSLSSETQMDLEGAETHMEAINQSKIVHVKFQLQKECLFGEQFFLVGDDSIFGLWDPSSAIPLDWSDGNVWTVELDIPIGKSILFKFMLKGITGEISWQPGPDRVFQTWETKNMIIVMEDWENAEVQKITEEPMANQNEEPMINPAVELIIPENVTRQKEQPMTHVDNEMTIANSITYAEEKQTAEANKNMFVAENITYPKEEHMAIVAQNISHPKKEPMANANKDLIVAESIHRSSNGKVVTDKKPVSTKYENLVTYDGDPVLVPGLTPLLAISTEEAPPNEDVKSIDADASVEIHEIKDYNTPKVTV